jgi:hypothetical protein
MEVRKATKGHPIPKVRFYFSATWAAKSLLTTGPWRP